MNDWFIWNGTRSIDMGVHVLEQPPPTMPNERVTFTSIPGRSGSLTTLEGDNVYDDLVLTATCIIAEPDRIPDVCAWLRGSGTVTFANRDGGFYYARVINQIPFEKILRGNPHRTFAVNFRCKPFWYQSDVAPQNIQPASGSTSGYVTMQNPGNVPSEPIITVTGIGEITLIVDMTIVELSDVNGEITIDSVLQEAYSGTTSMNNCMSGDFPTLPPGNSTISWTGNVTYLTVEPNWRYF